MKQKQTKRNLDSNGLYHGYQEWYMYGKLYCRGYAKHGQPYAYEEWHNKKLTRYHIR
jgi:hypothetical protein